jgi:hypothetical protein
MAALEDLQLANNTLTGGRQIREEVGLVWIVLLFTA